MVKKVSFKSGKSADDFDLDSFLNSSDDLSDSFDLGGDTREKGSVPFKAIGKGTIAGVKSSLKSASFYRTLTKAAIPSEYGDALDSTADLATKLGKLFDDSVKELKPGMQQIARQIDKLVPEEQKRLKGFTKKIKDLTGASLGDGSSFNPEQAREDSISSTMATVFGLQAEQQAKERAFDKAMSLTEQQVNLKRFNMSATLLSGIHVGIQRLNAYNDKINQSYQRKSLELQLRSLYVQTDSYALARTAFETSGRQMNEMLRLMAMPEQEKIKRSEAYQKKQQGRFGNFGSLLGRKAWGEAIKKRITTAVQEKVGSAKMAFESALMGLDSLESGKDMLDSTGMSPAEMVSSMLAEGGMDVLAGYAGSKVRGKFVKKGSKAHNKLGEISALLRDPTVALDKLKDSSYLKEDTSQYGSIKERLKELARSGLGFLKPPAVATNLGSRRMSAAELNAPASLTNKTITSINEVIPGYLARILREVQITRTGNDKTPLTEYNPLYGKFMSSNRSNALIQAKVRKDIGSYGFDYTLQNATSKIAGDQKLGAKSQEYLKQRIKTLSLDQNALLSSDQLLSEAFLATLPKKEQKELRALSGRFKKDVHPEYGANQNDASIALNSVRESLGDKRSVIEQYAQDPQMLASLRNMGLIKNASSGTQEIDLARYKELSTQGRGAIPVDKIVKRFTLDGLLSEALEAGILSKSIEGKYSVNAALYAQFMAGTLKLNKKDGFGKRLRQTLNGMKVEAPETSDRYAKEGIKEQKTSGILEGFKKTKFYNWMYRPGKGEGDPNQEHLGPMAQDLQKNLGDEVAPGGKKIDLLSMSGKQSMAVSELAKELDALKKSRETGADKTMRQSLSNIDYTTTRIALLIASGSGSYGMPGVDLNKIKELLASGKKITKEQWASLLDNAQDLQGNLAEKAGRAKTTAAEKAKILAGKIKGASRYLSVNARRKGRRFSNYMHNEGLPAIKKGASFAKNTALDLAAGTRDTIRNVFNRPVDIYSNRQPGVILMTAAGINRELYIDIKSEKVIRTLNDIKGPVADRQGNVVVSEEDLNAGLVDAEGKPIAGLSEKMRRVAESLFKGLQTAVVKGLPAGIRHIAQAGLFIKNMLVNTLNQPRDLYVKGNMTKPVLLARDMLAGLYIDLKSGKVIKTLSDIKGPIVNAEGNYVVTEEDFKKGLVDINDKPLVNFTGMVSGVVASVASGVKAIASKITGRISKLFKSKDKGAIDTPFGLASFSIFGNKTNSLLEEIRDILKDRLGYAGPAGESDSYTSDSGPSSQGAAKVGSSGIGLVGTFKGAKDLATGAVNALNTDKAKALRSQIGGRVRNSKLGQKAGSFLGKAGSLLSKIPGGGKVKALGGFASKLLGGFLNKDSPTGEGAQAEQAAVQQESAETAQEAQAEQAANKEGRKERRSAINRYKDVLTSQLGKFQKGTNMTEVTAKEKELEEVRRSRSESSAQASLDPKYVGAGAGVLSGLMSKVKGFKSMLSTAFSSLTSIPGLGKLGKVLSKIPGVGKLLGLGEEAGGLGKGIGLAGRIALGAGKFALGAGGWLARGAWAAAPVIADVGGAILSGAASLISAPVLLTGLAVAAVGAAAYYGFKFITRNNVTPLEQMRMTQYGLTPELNSYNHYFLNLEKLFAEKYIEANDRGQPQIRRGAVDMKKILDMLGVDKNNEQQVQNAALYLKERFIPVLLNATAAAWSVNSKVKITQVDKFTPEQLLKYMKVAAYENGPYTVDLSPFPQLPRLPANKAWVKLQNQKAMDYINKQLGKDKAEKEAIKKNPLKALANPDNVRDPAKAFVSKQKKEAEDKKKKDIKQTSIMGGFFNTLSNIKKSVVNTAQSGYSFYKRSVQKVASVINNTNLGGASEQGENLLLKGVRAAKGAFNKIKKLYEIYGVGAISAFFESGGNPAIVSSGQGDYGGASYGTFQLSSKTGGVQAFLKHFSGTPQVQKLLAAGPINSEEFKAVWRQLGNTDPTFAQMQAQYNKLTYLDPALNKLKAVGIDLSHRGHGVLSIVDATSDQYGPAGAKNVISAALAGKDYTKMTDMTDEQLITAIEDYKIKTVPSHFRSSSQAVQQSVAKRFATEKEAGIKLHTQTQSGAMAKVEHIDGKPNLAAGVKAAAASPSTPVTKKAATTVAAAASPSTPGAKKAATVAVSVLPSTPGTKKAAATTVAASASPSSQPTASAMPVSYRPAVQEVVARNAPVEKGQDHPFMQLGKGMDGVGAILKDSLMIQQAMLQSLKEISVNTGSTVSSTQRPSGAQAKAPQASAIPNPSIDLSRRSARPSV